MWGWSYTIVRGTLGQFGKTRSRYSKSWVTAHEKVIQNFKVLLDWQSHLGIEFDLFFGTLGIMSLLGETGSKYPRSLAGKSKK